MTVKDINLAYHDVFKKFLHVRLQLVKGVTYTKAFKEEFEARWAGKEIAISHLQGTCLDTNRWFFGEDLSIQMMSIAEFDMLNGDFLWEPIIFADFEDKVSNFKTDTILKLLPYIKEDKRMSFIDCVSFLKSAWTL